MNTLIRLRGTILTLAFLILVSGCNNQPKTAGIKITTNPNEVTYKVTFIELGSVRCIPCQMMQPVMKSIKEKYGTQVNVIFHDVWTEAGAPYSKKYGIEEIPTQVFLDKDGVEFYRHTGFFPEEELIKLLNQKGVR